MQFKANDCRWDKMPQSFPQNSVITLDISSEALWQNIRAAFEIIVVVFGVVFTRQNLITLPTL